MYKNNELKKSPLKFGFAVIATVCASLVSAQDIVPVSDITGGTSVFIFRGAARAVSRQFVTTTRARRSKTDRIETSKRVTKQYSKLAKIDPRRTRTDVVRPDDPRLRVRRTLEKDVGSRLLAGVGEYYMDRDDYNQAIDFFRDSLTMDANNAISKAGLSEALALKGNELLAKDAFPVARKFFEESLIYNDKNAPAYFGLAEVLTELDQTEAAAANYEKALSFDKELTEIYVPLGILYYQAGDIAKADNLLTKAVALDPNDAQSQLYLGLIRLSQARESGAQTRDKEALTAFNKAKSVDPKLAEAFYGAGVANSRLGDNRQAVTEFEQAVVLKSNYFDAFFGLGTAYFALGEYPKSIENYEKAKRLKNDNAEVVANLGDAYRQVGDFNKAETNYSLAALFFERQPDFANNKETREIAADTYGKIGFAVGKQCEANIQYAISCKWNVAVDSLKKAVAITNSPNDQANLGWALHNFGKQDIREGKTAAGKEKLEQGREALERAVAANPKFLEGPMLNLGMVYTDLGNNKQAIDTLKKVIQKEPKWVFALNELGIAYMNDGNSKEAAAQFKKAVDRDNKFAAAYYNLAKAEFKNGNLGEAKKAHARLKALGRTDLSIRLEVESRGAIRS